MSDRLLSEKIMATYCMKHVVEGLKQQRILHTCDLEFRRIEYNAGCDLCEKRAVWSINQIV